MTEQKFKYEVGGLKFANRGSDDFRLQVIDDLEISMLDEAYVAVFQSWQVLRGVWVEAKVKLDSAQQKLAGVEAEIRKNVDSEEYKARSAEERKAKLKAIVEADSDYQEVLDRVLTCKWESENIAASIEDAEKEMAHIKVRLNWRTFIVRFLGTVQPVSVQEMAL